MALDSAKVSCEKALDSLVIAYIVSIDGHLTTSFHLLGLSTWFGFLLFLGSFNISRKDLLVKILVPSCRERVDLAHRHELLYISIGDGSALCLEISNEFLEDLDEDSLDFTSEQFATRVFLLYSLKLIIVLHEEL